jgi:phosphatidylglycerol:prolipoprotein diacylglycerol transferase
MNFSFFLTIGAILGLADVYRQAGGTPHERVSRLDDAILLLLLAFAGARLDYTLMRWPYYSQNLNEIPQVWLGGLGWPGAVISSLLAVAIIGFLHRGTSRRRIADSLLPVLCPLAVVCWLGAWMQNEAYGLVVPMDAWYAVPIPDASGQSISRFPIQPIAAVFILAGCAVADYISSGCSAPGRKFSSGFLGFSIMMLASSFLRGDPSPMWLGFRTETWFAAAFVLIGLAGYIGTCLWQSNFQVPQTSNTI